MAHLSVNQLVSETRKAMLGTGYHFGVADDIARAAQWLSAHGFVPSDELLALMNADSKPEPMRPVIDCRHVLLEGAVGLADVMAGLDFCEAFEAAGFSLKGLLYPNLSRALIALRASPPTGRFALDEGAMLSSLIGSAKADIDLVRCAFAPDLPEAWPARITIDDDCYEMLKKRAFETYVPSSEKSRAAGAGAGLNDND